MLNRYMWARTAALIASLAIISAALPASSAFAQESPPIALEQARSGEDGTSGAGAGSGSTSTGNAKRDKNGNGGSTTVGSPGEGGTTEGGTTGSADSGSATLPENAEVLSALGVLDDVTVYGLDILGGLDIPVELLPPPPADAAPSAPDDINTGGQGSSGETTDGAAPTGETSGGSTSTGETSSISTEPGSGSAPAGGATNTAAADGVDATNSGEKVRDRPRKNADGGTDTAASG